MAQTIASGTLKVAPVSAKITAIPSAVYTTASSTPIQSTAIKNTALCDQFHGLIDITAVSGPCGTDGDQYADSGTGGGRHDMVRSDARDPARPHRSPAAAFQLSRCWRAGCRGPDGGDVRRLDIVHDPEPGAGLVRPDGRNQHDVQHQPGIHPEKELGNIR